MNEQLKEPIGIYNQGNTCYINSIIQALNSCELFHQSLKSLKHFNSCINNSNNICIKCQFISYIVSLNHSYKAITLENLSKFLFSISTQFVTNKQEDAHELLSLLLSKLLTHYSYNPFKSSLVSSIECLTCNKISNTVDPIEGIEIGIDQTCYLEGALDNYCSNEILMNENAYACSHCKTKTIAKKYLRIGDPPDILTIQLKRFTPNSTKVQHHIEFSNKLNLTNYLSAYSNIKSTCLYELTAVVVHIGASLTNGHYVTYLYKREIDSWFRADDSVVRHCSLVDVLDQNAYLLFYQLVDKLDNQSNHSNKPLGSYMDNRIHRDIDSVLINRIDNKTITTIANEIDSNIDRLVDKKRRVSFIPVFNDLNTDLTTNLTMQPSNDNININSFAVNKRLFNLFAQSINQSHNNLPIESSKPNVLSLSNQLVENESTNPSIRKRPREYVITVDKLIIDDNNKNINNNSIEVNGSEKKPVSSRFKSTFKVIGRVLRHILFDPITSN